MRRCVKSLAAGFAVVFLLVGCGGVDLANPDNRAGERAEKVVDFPADLLKQKLMQAHTPGVDANTTVFGYRAYKIRYETVDESGMPVEASGLMVVPSDYGTAPADRRKLQGMRQLGFSLVSDSHGTIFADAEAPTVSAETGMSPEGSAVLFTALGGFVTLQADYVGFGESAGRYHPYLLARSSAASTVDFIRAARAFARSRGIPLNGQLFVTGYSEGGYVAMAALKALEEAGEPVALAAPMAGPYMLDRMAQGVLSGDTLPIPSFMADVAYAYAQSYGQPVDTLVKEPYASRLPSLFDGSHSRPEIDERLSHLVGELFSDEAIGGVLDANSSYWFYRALQANSTAYWSPRSSLRLLHCLGDDVVPYVMSSATADLMTRRLGARDVAAVPVEPTVTGDPQTRLRMGHAECAPSAYAIAVKLFGAVRRQSIGY